MIRSTKYSNTVCEIGLHVYEALIYFTDSSYARNCNKKELYYVY